MKNLICVMLCALASIAFMSCGSDKEAEPASEAQLVANRLNGAWTHADIASVETYTFAAFPSERKISNANGVEMAFNGSLNTKDVYNSGKLDFEFDYYFIVDPGKSLIKAYSMSDDKSVWTPVIYQEYKYAFKEDGSLALTDKYGTDVFTKK